MIGKESVDFLQRISTNDFTSFEEQAVQKTLPYGTVTVKAVKGGLDVPDEAVGDVAVIASAAVAVHLDLPE